MCPRTVVTDKLGGIQRECASSCAYRVHLVRRALLHGWAQFELARAPHHAYVGFLCMWACLALIVIATVRVKADLGTGLLTGVIFAITIIEGQFTWPSRSLWGQVGAHPAVFFQ